MREEVPAAVSSWWDEIEYKNVVVSMIYIYIYIAPRSNFFVRSGGRGYFSSVLFSLTVLPSPSLRFVFAPYEEETRRGGETIPN
eukprot:gene5854-4177_t